jgi:hypothetical protein
LTERFSQCVQLEADVASRALSLRLRRVTVTLRERYVDAVIKVDLDSIPWGDVVGLGRQRARSGGEDDGKPECCFGQHGIPPFMAIIDRTV